MITQGMIVDDGKTSRNRQKIGALLHAIEENGFTAAFGGGSPLRGEGGAKERVYSHRDEFGERDPKMQRPELWSLYKGASTPASTCGSSRSPRAGHLDYMDREQIEIPSIYFATSARVIHRDGMWLSLSDARSQGNEKVETKMVRFPPSATSRDRARGRTASLPPNDRRDRHRPGDRARRDPR